MIPYSRPKLFDFIPYPRVNCLKTIIPFIEAHTYIAHIWRYPPLPLLGVVSLPLRACAQVEGVTLVLGLP